MIISEKMAYQGFGALSNFLARSSSIQMESSLLPPKWEELSLKFSSSFSRENADYECEFSSSSIWWVKQIAKQSAGACIVKEEP